MSLSLLLDVVIVALLVPTIIYAVILNNRLASLRKNRDALAKVVHSFNEATVRAESGIPRLRRAADEAAEALAARVEKAHGLRDDLAFMVERAEELADRLENALKGARGEVRPSPGAALAQTPAAVRKPAPAEPDTAPAPMPTPTLARRAARVVPGESLSPRLDGEDADLPDDERSEAERALLQALQSVR
ncbi:DUF6468 domain-containing protein [Roseospirillum parvum]|uniref:DUF6468 domain-containing protein n=1 Tax=Roseospirillum parvum TaxID=83401 RepID=A0A1G8FG46_9PROT|nr:DUF6468 domain-containing protein [Roseospirillum parvum]SDH81113.1 hypothetical protein SAMN05421742_11410 [Roseospirillum parvum]